jgi:uncharacterized OsmC-like protein
MISNAGSVPTTVTHIAGQKFAIQIRSHTIIVDQTIRSGGDDTAPTPIELLSASIGSCVAYYVRQFLEKRNLPTGGLRVEVTQQSAPHPARITDFQVRVELAHDVPPHLKPVLARVIEVCPAYNTLSLGANVSVAFGAPVNV